MEDDTVITSVFVQQEHLLRATARSPATGSENRRDATPAPGPPGPSTATAITAPEVPCRPQGGAGPARQAGFSTARSLTWRRRGDPRLPWHPGFTPVSKGQTWPPAQESGHLGLRLQKPRGTTRRPGLDMTALPAARTLRRAGSQVSVANGVKQTGAALERASQRVHSNAAIPSLSGAVSVIRTRASLPPDAGPTSASGADLQTPALGKKPHPT